jgi:hypothetical protein
VAHFVDVTVTSESNVAEAIKRKKAQYEGLLAYCKSRNIKAHLHVIPVGLRGFIPHHTTKALTDLGLNGKARLEWERKVGRLLKESCVGLLWSRRAAEMALGNAHLVSGFYRYQEFRKIKKNLRGAYASARPPGGQTKR